MAAGVSWYFDEERHGPHRESITRTQHAQTCDRLAVDAGAVGAFQILDAENVVAIAEPAMLAADGAGRDAQIAIVLPADDGLRGLEPEDLARVRTLLNYQLYVHRSASRVHSFACLTSRYQARIVEQCENRRNRFCGFIREIAMT